MTIQDAIDMEHGRFKDHQSFQPSEDFVFNFHIMSLCANVVGCAAEPPKCKKCNEFVLATAFSHFA